MTNGNARKKLETLTPREATVLYWQCKKELRPDIAKRVHLSVSRVQDHLGDAHEKIGFTKDDHSSVRDTVLQKEYCETLETMVEELKNQEGFVEKGVFSFWPPRQETPSTTETEEEGPTRRRVMPVIGGVVGVIALICLCTTIAGVAYWFGSRQTSTGQPADVVEAAPPTAHPEETIAPSTEAPLPTPTEMPTEVPSPLPPTDTPAPSVSLPFADNFDTGMRSEWESIYGNWYTADGKLTVFEERLKWQFIVLDDPTWTNYNISLDTHIPVLGSANQGEVSIIIRYSRLRQEQIYFYLGRISGAGWVVGNPQEIHPKYISERENRASIQDNNHIQLEAYGNNFTAYMNGSFVQTISINSFDDGGVMLGIRCNNEGTCPSIDNILIEPIN